MTSTARRRRCVFDRWYLNRDRWPRNLPRAFVFPEHAGGNDDIYCFATNFTAGDLTHARARRCDGDKRPVRLFYRRHLLIVLRAVQET